MRKNTKAKASTISRKLKETGGGPKAKLELNQTENAIYELLGQTAVMGHKDVVESHAQFVSTKFHKPFNCSFCNLFFSIPFSHFMMMTRSARLMSKLFNKILLLTPAPKLRLNVKMFKPVRLNVKMFKPVDLQTMVSFTIDKIFMCFLVIKAVKRITMIRIIRLQKKDSSESEKILQESKVFLVVMI